MITIHNRYIFKDGQQYHPRGWTYQNIRIGQGSGRSFAKEPLQIPYDLADMIAAGTNCTRLYYDQYDSGEYTTALNLFAEYGIDVIMFYYVPHNTDYSVATGGANRSSVISAVQEMVTNLSGFSAIVGWGIGNEVNYELGGTSLKDYFTMINEAAGAVKGIDSTRFTTTAHGEMASIISTGQYFCPNIDVWGVNLYRGRSFGTLLKQVDDFLSKPFIITEYGFDAYDSVGVEGEDQAGQASRNINLTQELESYYPYIAGYFNFQWADGWFKASNNSTHDTTGNVSTHDDRDSLVHEEWFGATEALSEAGVVRTKRQTYTIHSEYWNNKLLPTSSSKRLLVI